MSETDVARVLVGDPLEATFPRHYTAKEFTHDAGRFGTWHASRPASR